MKTSKNILYTVLCLAWGYSLLSCSKMDDYMKYAKDAKYTYIGRPDSILFLSGHNRMMLYSELSSDPKITKMGVFWNNKADSILFDVDFASEKVVKRYINLPEGSYNFDVYTYDAYGNASIPTNASGNSYGDNYISGLFNRVVKSCFFEGNDIAIEWYSGSENSPYSIVSYLDKNGVTQQVTVTTKEDKSILHEPATNQFNVLSYFVPEKGAVDLFSMEHAKTSFVTDITKLYLKNPGPNIDGTERVSWKWGVPKDWNITDNIRNQEGSSIGGWSSEGGGRIHLETKDWDGPGFDNGKIWQTSILQPGTYDFTVFCSSGHNEPIAFVTVNKGTTLPDISNMNNEALSYTEIPTQDGRTDKEYTTRFVITEPTELSLGLVVTIEGTSHYIQFSYFKLKQVPEE